jgi:hypothetical protein
MTTQQPITTCTSKSKNQDTEQEPRPATDTDHYTEQTTRHEQQDPRTKRSRERSEDAHRGITIRGSRPASGRPPISETRAGRLVDLHCAREDCTRRWSGC